jgi:hypothetical protein
MLRDLLDLLGRAGFEAPAVPRDLAWEVLRS